MYHAIVRRRIEALFASMNAGDPRPIIDGFTPQGEHLFIGNHALAGRRRGRAEIAAWYARLGRLLPDLRFTLHRITVSGPPWRTLAVIEWREQNSATDGVLTRANGVHVVELRWGRMTRLTILPDTAALQATLERIAAKGVAEAAAAPIGQPQAWPGA